MELCAFYLLNLVILIYRHLLTEVHIDLNSKFNCLSLIAIFSLLPCSVFFEVLTTLQTIFIIYVYVVQFFYNNAQTGFEAYRFRILTFYIQGVKTLYKKSAFCVPSSSVGVCVCFHTGVSVSVHVCMHTCSHVLLHQGMCACVSRGNNV